MTTLHICKDSTALYLTMQEYLGNNFLPLFANTGHEHPVTVNYVRNLHHMTGGPQVQIIEGDFSSALKRRDMDPTGNAFLDMMLWKGRAPSTKAQFCTEHLKLWPMLFFLQKNYPKDQYEWIMYTGIRQAESASRRKRYDTHWKYNPFYECDTVMPLLKESEEFVFSLLESHGVPPNPLYAMGYSRVGCFPCIHARKDELMLLPDWAWERLEWYESHLGRSWFPSGILPGKPKGYIPSIAEVREWAMTSRGGSQYNLFRSQPTSDTPSCMTGWHECE